MRPWLLPIGLLAACSPHGVTHDPPPPLELPDSYGEEAPGRRASLPERWWRGFGDPQLSRLVEVALQDNFDLHGAWARLAQADAMADQADAPLWPSLDLQASMSQVRSQPPSEEIEPFFDKNSTPLRFSASAAYELDIWRKLGSRASAAALDRAAARDAVEGLAMTLSAQVAETWFDLVRARALRALLQEQLEVNNTFLELTRVRFEQGLSSALDVYQQRQRVTGTEAQLTLVDSREAVLQHRLAVLLGKPPRAVQTRERAELPELAELPGLGLPSQLLKRRPDVRAARRRVEAADYRLAAAIADRYPSLRLTGSASYGSNDILEQALAPIFSVAANLLAPIFDGGRRAAEVDRTRAVMAERVSAYGQTLLTALSEVEGALAQERQQRLNVEKVEEQVEIGESTLREARNRYRQGLSDFLPVLSALAALQQSEQALLDSRRQLLSFRIQLYRALGGTWTARLQPPEQKESS